MLPLLALAALLPGLALATAKASPPQYQPGDAIPVSCLNRTIDTGEHIVDERGQLQYIPFPVCNETGKPLELQFGIEKDLTCTIDFIDDTFFHLLEFYIHNDAPLTCRIPSRPLSMASPSLKDAAFAEQQQLGALGTQSTAYVPMVIALAGTLQLSHLHVAHNLNVLLHAAPRKTHPGVVDAATAYSVNTATRNTKIVIGDSLPLRLSIRWYPNSQLPSGWAGVGGHLTATTVIYCLLSAGAAAAVCIAWFRGFELPRRLRTHGRERLGLGRSDSVRGYSGAHSGGGGGSGGGLHAAGGVGNGWGYAGPGKVD